MIFKPMKQEELRKLIDGHQDILKKAVEDNEIFFKNLSCPECGSKVMPILNTSMPFKKDGILPNYLAKCHTCEIEFEPYSKIRVNSKF